MGRSRRRASGRGRQPAAMAAGQELARQKVAARGPARRKPVARRRGPSPAQLTLAAGAAILVVAAVVVLVRSSANLPSGSAAASIPDPPAVSTGSLAEGRPAPDFTGTAFDGQKVTLSDLRGKPVLINFFAS